MLAAGEHRRWMSRSSFMTSCAQIGDQVGSAPIQSG
jgi:hypothetical protein